MSYTYIYLDLSIYLSIQIYIYCIYMYIYLSKFCSLAHPIAASAQDDSISNGLAGTVGK